MKKALAAVALGVAVPEPENASNAAPVARTEIEATAARIMRRELLRGVMFASGFTGVDNEWWHFDMGDRQHVRSTFTRVE